MMVIGTFQTCQSQRRMSIIEGIARAQCVRTEISLRDRVSRKVGGRSLGVISLKGGSAPA